MRLLLVLAASSLLSHAALAATFTVISGADAGPGSLRDAMVQANQAAGADLIAFDIPPSDPSFQTASAHWRIDISTSALPAVTDQLIIDGYTQAGAQANTLTPDQGGSNALLKIELRNATSTSVVGIDGFSNNFLTPMVVRGLNIHSFTSQVQLAGGSVQRVEGCFLGTTIDGSLAASSINSSRIGVRVQGPGAYRIGGLTAVARNVISGDSTGIAFFTAPDGVRIEGNLIGTNAAGTTAISPRAIGISAGSYANLMIGGNTTNARNLISGNGLWGVRLNDGSSSSAKVQGNFIGSDWSGRRPIPNGLNPFSPSQRVSNVIMGSSSCNMQFGGALPGEENLIAYGAASGVVVDRCRNPAHRNRFFGNSGAALDNVNGGGANGATPNDVGDPDTGGNQLQNFPDVELPSNFLPSGANSVQLDYRVDSLPANSNYPMTIEFHRGTCGGGSGGVLLGSDIYEAEQAGMLKSILLSAGDGGNVLPLVAVAVDALGNVSEFSPMQGDDLFRSGFEDALDPPSVGICQ